MVIITGIKNNKISNIVSKGKDTRYIIFPLPPTFLIEEYFFDINIFHYYPEIK